MNLSTGQRSPGATARAVLDDCTGKSLTVRDLRHLSTAEDIFEAIVEHLRLGTNGGKIRPVMSVFASQMPPRPGIRIWNPQVIQYAGYRLPDGSTVGDPSNEELTTVLRQL